MWHCAAMEICPLRAHPDSNQGLADLQSAALTTELCTHVMCNAPCRTHFTTQPHLRAAGCATVLAAAPRPLHHTTISSVTGVQCVSVCGGCRMVIAVAVGSGRIVLGAATLASACGCARTAAWSSGMILA